MNVYGTEQIRNVVLLGHGGAGKTTVAEALALLTGVTKRMGKVPDGNTISDYDKEEIKRQFSISTTLIPLEYEGEDGPIKINLLDTPGFFDFVGEVEEAISVADAAIIVVNCKAGIEPGTERAWEMCEKYNLPRLIFVTNMDDDHASYRELVVKLETKFGRKIAPFQLPIRENEKFVGFVNVVKMGGRRFTHLSDYEECEIPDYVQKNLTIARDALIEAVAETSEEYMERYFLGEEFTQEEISTALREHVIEGEIVPVMMGSGINCQGFKVLLQSIDKYFPSPDHFECKMCIRDSRSSPYPGCIQDGLGQMGHLYPVHCNCAFHLFQLPGVLCRVQDQCGISVWGEKREAPSVVLFPAANPCGDHAHRGHLVTG